MTALEDALSAAFRERVDRPGPDVGALAERAIARGRAYRVRRLSGLAAAVVLCAVVTAGFVVVVGGAPKPLDYSTGTDLAAPGEYVAVSSPMPPSSSDLPVDYVQEQWLYLRSGRSVRLPSGNVTQVQRAGDGFVVVEQGREDGDQRAWYVNERSGAPIMVLDNVRSVAVSTDGEGRMAWLAGSKMYYRETAVPVAPIAATVQPVETDRPAAGRPVGFVGDAVLLADSGPAEPGSTGPERHDLWFPDRGDYVPTWATFFAVYGGRASSELVVAKRVEKRVCLGLARINTLTLDTEACHYIDRAPTRGWVSPSGRWLVVADEHQAQMVDLLAGWRTGAQVKWSVDRVGSDAAWLDRDTVALHTSTGVVVLSPFAPDKAVEYKVPGLSLIVSQ
ncbi:hypothetical protein [Virgisporangium aurantiacum]|uniref:Uncharacterized protein n=1 Tax=Virgisporangium aurantiacum TaxID=175570 RepID=A0A8J4DXS3_9ACTN|nr:hypothetical protein [Virgisporangium aurantiacum]GIJ53668.1 hypothetical protein Vau01_011840 [Virgisporangium aurantiacum]